MKNFARIALALLLLSTPVLAQETAEQPASTSRGKTYQPDVKGSLLFAVGLNMLSNAPEAFELKTWGSKSVNLYYLYDINLGSSRWSFHPGVGLGFERYELKVDNLLTLTYNAVNGSNENVLILDSLQNVYGSGAFKKNRLGANYVDVPLEFSWVGNKTNPKGGFEFAFGGKLGILYGSQMKMKYTVGDDTRKDKLKRDWNLNPFRYSAHARVGYSSFNVYFEYQLSDLFDAGDGPQYPSRAGATDPVQYTALPNNIANWRVGLAIDLF